MADLNCFIEELIKDYFTANIKAEVAIDTLITPIISYICRNELGETVLLTKEMPIVNELRTEANKNSRSLSCCNADFVLLSKKCKIVYIVELKTSETSENEEQLENYKKKIEKYTFGNLLLDLFDILYSHSLNGRYNGLKEGKKNEDLAELVNSILNIDSNKLKEGSTVKSIADKEYQSYTQGAELYLRENEIHKKNKDSSEKYLMTAARLLDALVTAEIDLTEIATYKMQLVYVLPNGVKEIPDVTNIYLNTGFEPQNTYGEAVKDMFTRLWNR